MKISKFQLFTGLVIVVNTFLSAQTDQDAIRYSRAGTGGTARFAAMGGAFGAIGADLSTASTNPAGLALFRRGEIAFSAGLLFTTNKATVYKQPTTIRDIKFVFNNFGIAFSWVSGVDPESRHLFAFVNNQQQNYFTSTRMTGYTNTSSIAKDMLNIANTRKGAADLNSGYEGLGFSTYLLDTIDGKFISLLDVNRTIKQTRDIVTSGKLNDLNISYAYTYKDKYYVGASLGIPQLDYISTTTHYESDDNDSIRLEFNQDGGYSHTFKEGLPAVHDYYGDMGAFNSLVYEEYFKTTGSGFNLKLGGIARVNDMLRLGFYYHTPTIFRLKDSYINQMDVTFDKAPNTPESSSYPENGGVFEYRMVTPSKLGANMAWLFGKKAVVGLDYELVNYTRAHFSSENLSDFENTNSLIISKYTRGHNVRVGFEYNLNPFMLRAGYNMNGSPFGEVFSGSFVRNSVSLGVGLRMSNSFYLDMAWVQTVSSDDYYLFSNLSTRSKINYNNSLITFTGGIKF